MNEVKLSYLPVGCSLTSSRDAVQRNQSEVGSISFYILVVDGFMLQKRFNLMTIHVKSSTISGVHKNNSTIRSNRADYEWASPMRFEFSRKEMQLEITQKDFLATRKIFPKDALVIDPLHFVRVLLGQVIGIIPKFFHLR